MTLRVLGLDGSPLAHSHTAWMLRQALGAAQGAGAVVEHIRLADRITRPFMGKWEAGHLTPELELIVTSMLNADALIFATPTWWSMPSDHMKILLSAMTALDARDYPLTGKVAAVMAVCDEDGAQHANMLIMNTLVHMGCVIAPFSGSFFYNKNMKGRSEDNWQETDQRLVGRMVVRLASILTASDQWPL